MPINIFQAQDYKTYLNSVLGDRCGRNAQYSLRAFGRDIETAPSFLSLLFNGKAELSLEKARIIADRLRLVEHEHEYFVALVHKGRTGDGDVVASLRDKFAFAALDLKTAFDTDFFLKDFALYLKISLIGPVRREQAKSIFALSEDDFTAACHRLQNLGWIEEAAEGGWRALKGNLRTECYDKSETLRIFHKKFLELADEQLENGDVKSRHFYSSFFSLKQTDYEDLCKTIVEFCRSRTDAYESRDSHDMIYTLSLQILPVGGFKRPRK